MIEVFKTNINCPDKAKQLVEAIHLAFKIYKANFDLKDCDRILRVECNNGNVTTAFIHWLINNGCCAEILSDN